MATRRRQAIALSKTETGTYGTQAEKINREYWDEEILAAAVPTVRLFQVPMGGGKTRAQTNMILGGQIPTGVKFLIKTIAVYWVSVPGAGPATKRTTTLHIEELYDQLANTTLQVKIENKDVVFEATLQRLFGINFAVAVNVTATQNFPFPMSTNNGLTVLRNHITLAAQTPFHVEIQHNTAIPASCVGDRFKVGLMGPVLRVG